MIKSLPFHLQGWRLDAGIFLSLDLDIAQDIQMQGAIKNRNGRSQYIQIISDQIRTLFSFEARSSNTRASELRLNPMDRLLVISSIRDVRIQRRECKAGD